MALRAQSWSRSLNPDSLSWQLYQQGRWDDLLRTGRQLHRQGVDYYFLRMRLAVAAIETHKYDQAARHLSKALQFNPSDPQARRLLVLARQYSLMPTEAGAVFAKLPESQRNDLPIRSGFGLLTAHVDVGNTISNHKTSENFETLAGEAGVYGSQSGLTSSGVADAGLWMQLKPGWMLYAGAQHFAHIFGQNYAYLNPKMKTDRVEINGNYKDFYYRIDTEPTVFTSGASVVQNTAYLQMRHAPAHHIMLVASAGISKLEGEYPYAQEISKTFTDTARLDLNTGLATLFSIDVPAIRVSNTLWQTTDYRFVLGGVMHFGGVSPGAAIHLGRVNDTSILQLQLGYTWRVAGNARTWQQTEIFLLGTRGSLRPAVKVSAGQWLGRKTYLSAVAIAGHLNGMADQWGYVTLNHREKIMLFGDATFYHQLIPRLGINIRYRQSRSFYLEEQIDNEQQLQISAKSLTSHGIIGGLIWNF